MKKLTNILLSSALALAAGHAAAQTVAHATAQGAMQGAVQAASQALVTAATSVPGPAASPAPRPQAPVVKDFAAARAFELERSKFHLGAIEKFRKCVDGSKAASDLATCQATYRAALTANVDSLVKQGKMAAAYGTPAPVAPGKPAVAPRK